MKFLIASDIHGSAAWCRRLMDALDAEQPDRLLLLGDILYHGPRNDLPEAMRPRRSSPCSTRGKIEIFAVRGNCDAEVDQMVLDFPCMADYTTIFDPAAALAADGTAREKPGCELFLTHGHVYGAGFHNSVDRLPELPAGSILLYGHTHKKVKPTCAHARGRLGVQPRQRLHPQGRHAQLRRLRERRRSPGRHGGIDMF